MTEANFHELRLTGIGGSDCAAALGISPWRTAYDLWLEKTNADGFVPRAATEAMEWGQRLEALITTEYVRRTNRMVHEQPDMLRHPVHTWMIAHLDGLVVDEERILEVKTARTSEGWGEPGSDEVPLVYSAQAHHYLTVSGVEICDIAVLVSGSDFRIYTVHADPVIAAELIGREAEFWQRVEQRNPPNPVNLDDARARWGKLLIEGAVEAGEGELRAIETLRWCRDQRATLEAAESEAKLALMTALGEHGDTLVDADGTRLCTWALDRGRKAYTVEERAPARRFLLKG